MPTTASSLPDSKQSNHLVDNLDFKIISTGMIKGAKSYLDTPGNDTTGIERAKKIEMFVEFLQKSFDSGTNTALSTTDAKSNDILSNKKILKKNILLLYLAVKKINSKLYKNFIKPKITIILEENSSFFSKTPDYPTQWLLKYAYKNQQQISDIVDKIVSLLNSTVQSDQKYPFNLLIFSLVEEWQHVIQLAPSQRDAAVNNFYLYLQDCDRPSVEIMARQQAEIDHKNAEIDAAEQKRKAVSLQLQGIVTGSTSTPNSTAVNFVPSTKKVKYDVKTIPELGNFQTTGDTIALVKNFEVGLSTYLSNLKVDSPDKDRNQAILALVIKFKLATDTPSIMLYLLLGALIEFSYSTGNHDAIFSVTDAILKDEILKNRLFGNIKFYLNHPHKTRRATQTAIDEYRQLRLPEDYCGSTEFFTATATVMLLKAPRNIEQLIARLEDELSVVYLKLIEISIETDSKKLKLLQHFFSYLKKYNIGKNPDTRCFQIPDVENQTPPVAQGSALPVASAPPAANHSSSPALANTALTVESSSNEGQVAANTNPPAPALPVTVNVASQEVAVSDVKTQAADAKATVVSPIPPPPPYTSSEPVVSNGVAAETISVRSNPINMHQFWQPPASQQISEHKIAEDAYRRAMAVFSSALDQMPNTNSPLARKLDAEYAAMAQQYLACRSMKTAMTQPVQSECIIIPSQSGSAQHNISTPTV